MRRRRSRLTVPEATGNPGTMAGERKLVLPPAAWTALSYVVFTALYGLTFKSWILPFQDSGREIGVAARLALGEAIYRDVAYWFGPLPPLADAAVLRLGGFHLDGLLAVRLVVALLGVEALRRLARRLFDSPPAAAWAVSAVVALCSFGGNGGSWAFPYAGASLEGFVLGLWALEVALASRGWGGSLMAALLAAVAAGTKVEYAPFSLLGLAVALGLGRPRREAVVSTAAAATCGALFWLVPLARYGGELLRTQGFLIALDIPGPWKLMYRRIAWGYFAYEGNLLIQVLQSYFPGLLLVGISLALARKFGTMPRRVALIVFALGVVAGWLPYNWGLHVFIPAAAVVVAAGALRIGRTRERNVPGDRSVALLAAGAATLSLFVRQPLFLMRLLPYSAFSGPLPLLISFCFVARLLKVRPVAAALLAGLTLGASISAARDWTADVRTWVRFPRGSLRLPVAEGRLVRELVDRLVRDTGEGSFVAGFPEPGLVLFLADRRNPFPWEQFNPGDQGVVAEGVMIRDLETRRPEAAFIVNRPVEEFGGSFFGEGYLERFDEALRRGMKVEHVFRPPPGPRTPAVRGDGALYFRPRGRPAP
jgi:hypothetical protein